MLQSQGATHHNDRLPLLDLANPSQLEVRQCFSLGIDPDDSQIMEAIGGVNRQHWQLHSLGRFDGKLSALSDDMEIGHHQVPRRNYKTGPYPLLPTIPGGH
jgi:hypothetical protein